jgi:hypothetical protein
VIVLNGTGVAVANQEHVEILKKRAAKWNAWRDSNRMISPDLSGANLSGVGVGCPTNAGARGLIKVS